MRKWISGKSVTIAEIYTQFPMRMPKEDRIDMLSGILKPAVVEGWSIGDRMIIGKPLKTEDRERMQEALNAARKTGYIVCHPNEEVELIPKGGTIPSGWIVADDGFRIDGNLAFGMYSIPDPVIR